MNKMIEREQSLKAGLISGLAFTLAYSLGEFVKLFLLIHVSDGLILAIRMAIAFISGFLFGVTYLYIVRQDENSHLKDGAVLAFSLVRGLALVELSENYVLLAILGIESICCFAIARLSIDWALKGNLIEPHQ